MLPNAFKWEFFFEKLTVKAKIIILHYSYLIC